MSKSPFKAYSLFTGRANGSTANPGSQKYPSIQSGNALLANFDDKILAEIHGYLACVGTDKKRLVDTLMQDYAAFVQLYPETRTGFYSGAGGLLEYALERTLTGLKLADEFFAQDTDEVVAVKSQQPLWMYLVFSGLLLHNIGVVVTDLQVNFFKSLSDTNGERWMPFAGEMPQDHYYDYHIDIDDDNDYQRFSTILLARQLMPEKGFQWIASQPTLMKMWLGLLHDDITRTGGFRFLCKRAIAAVLKQRAITLSNAAQGAQDKQSFALDVFRQLEQNFDTIQLSEAFTKWLEGNLANEKFTVNRDHVFTDGKEVLITEKGIQEFRQDKANRQFRQVSEKQLLEALVSTQVISEATQALSVGDEKVSGRKIENPFRVLPEQVRIVPPGGNNPQQITSTTALMYGLSLGDLTAAPTMGPTR